MVQKNNPKIKDYLNGCFLIPPLKAFFCRLKKSSLVITECLMVACRREEEYPLNLIAFGSFYFHVMLFFCLD